MLAESRSAGGLPGGDFYTFALRAPTRLAVVIGDACGRGRDGAELVPLVLPVVDALLPTEASPAQLLCEVNRTLYGSVAKDRFITAAAFELDASTGSLVAACAGHVPTIIRNAEGRVRAVGTASGPPLGIEKECEYSDERHALTMGDVLVFMTDGLLEALETDLIAMERLQQMVASAPAGNGAVHRFLLAELDRCTLRSRSDDVLLLSLEVVGETGSRRAAADDGAT